MGGEGGRSEKVMIFILIVNTEKVRLELKALPPTSPERKCSINISVLKNERIGFYPIKFNNLQRACLNAREAGGLGRPFQGPLQGNTFLCSGRNKPEQSKAAFLS